MRVAVVGGGILGLTMAHRVARLGHRVDLFEAEAQLGGLAAAHDYGPFVWDRFYHCILPQDTALIALLDELGMTADLRWKRTDTGYYARGRFHDMSGNRDFLRFPLLTLVDKARLGAAIVYATRFADPNLLYRVSAEQWLTRLCGRRAYAAFWQPLLKAKFGPFHDQVAAVFIYATLKRLFGARTATAGQESLGYVHGGYRRIIERLSTRLETAGATVRASTPVIRIAPTSPGATLERPPAGPAPVGGCSVAWRGTDGRDQVDHYEQVLFTAPSRLARRVADAAYHPHVEAVERANPTSSAYLGVACLVLALERPLTPYYVLNIGDPSIELTGLIEMTNLIDPAVETKGLSLLYLPRYMDSESPGFADSDATLMTGMVDRGLKRLFPDFEPARARYSGVHRARYVQPLPLVRSGGDGVEAEVPVMTRPFQIVNTSMLRCATLNNNEVVALVDRFLTRNRGALQLSTRP